MKKILIVSNCRKRRETIGLIGCLLKNFEKLDKKKYHITLFDTNFFELNHNPADYKVNSYRTLNRNPWDCIIRHIPRYRTVYAEQKAVKSFLHLMRKEHFDLVVVYQIPDYADCLVEIAHANGAKIVFEPFGSDILRASGSAKKKMKKAFSEVDGVIGRKQSNVLIAAQEVYKVPASKIKEQREVVRGVMLLKNLKGKLTREEMQDALGVPYSDYNIVCGYSGRESHRHRTIIDALIKVKDVLPDNYQIIFPMTYGAGAHHEIIINYANELKAICDDAGLKTVFVTEFKTEEQMACLHLVTDLFIEIQPTDNGNAFMIEALFAQNQIVTGRWLGYKRFEQFGEPYFLIDEPKDLPIMLRKIFTHQVKNAKVPQELVDLYDLPEEYDPTSFWIDLFEAI